MCGVGGCVVPLGQSPDSAALGRMAAALGHRGPDGCGIEIEGTVGLVNTRLAVVDPTHAGAQPMRHPSGRWLVTYNGELYDHADLRRELPLMAYAGHGDTETLLNALATWGAGAVARLNGPFAFAALDIVAGRLLLARDRFGEKPLYVAQRGGTLWFASEMRALLAAGIPRRARRDVLAHSVALSYPPGPVTPIEGVERLEPGTYAEVDVASGAASFTSWYAPSEAVQAKRSEALASLDRARLVSLLEESLRAAVRKTLVADVPLGVMCSGGLDSSLIAALAQQEGGALVAFAGSVEGRRDELPWARAVARHIGIELEVAPIDSESWRSGLVRAVDHFEYPLPHESVVAIPQISELARRHGVKAMLVGEGADELFGGYRQYMAPEFDAVFGSPRRSSRVAPSGAGRGQAALGGGSRLLAGVRASAEISAYESQLMRASTTAYGHHRGARRALEAGLLRGLSTYSLPFLLNRMDKNAMQCSVETRVPFLDPDVVGLSLNLPLEHRVGRERKSLLREMGRRHLPTEVAERPKQVGLKSDARRWLDRHARPEFLHLGSLREALRVPVGTWTDAVRGLSDGAVLRVWSGEIWCRLMLEGAGIGAVERELWR